MEKSAKTDKKRSPIAAFLLNLVFYPAGYVYVGKTGLGITIYVVLAVLSVATFLLSINFPPGVYGLTRHVGPAYGAIFLLTLGLSAHAAYLAREKRERLKGLRLWAAGVGLPLLLYAIALVLGPNYWPYPAYNIPSESGTPTILNGDMVVAKGSKTHCGTIAPKAGDVVIYRRQATSYIKRLVGMPGDSVRFDRGVLIINGKPVSQKVEDQTKINLGGFTTKADVVRETMPNGKSYLIELVDRSQPPENTQPVTLGQDQYFFVGDNRDNSLDSRFDGPTTKDNLCGVAVKIVYSSAPSHIGMKP